MASHRQTDRIRSSANVLQFVVLTGMLILLGRVFYLQIIEYQTFSPLSMQNHLRMEVVEPSRGLIFDRNGKILVENRPIYSITVTPARFDTTKTGLLADLLQVEDSLVAVRLDEARNYSWHRKSKLFTEVPFELFSTIQENLWQLPGIGHQVESKRHYPTEVKASHVFGYLREATREEYLESEDIRLGDKIGKSGLEMAYESDLKGKVGTEYIRVNAFGQALGPYDEGSLDVSPTQGADLVTTLDADLQHLAERLMEHRKGGAVAIDPQTGGILSLVSTPDYDLSKLSGRMDAEYWQEINANPDAPLFNRAISSRQPPGSTFKPFMGLVGMELGLVTPETEIYNPGAYYRGRAYGDLADPGDYDLEKALAYSSNTYFFWMMDRIASRGMLNRWADLIRDFGIGPVSQVDLPFERSGIIPDSSYMNRTFGDRYWGVGDLMSLGVGQGMVSVSPLQMAVATASLANGGYKVRPHLVSAVKQPDGTYHYTSPSMEKIEWIDDYELETVKKGMKRVVIEGSGRFYANIPGIEVAGKTGTAQNPHGENHGWFIAFAPADDPQIAVAVLSEMSGFGSTTAAPVAALLIEQYLTGEISQSRQYILNLALNFRPKSNQPEEEE